MPKGKKADRKRFERQEKHRLRNRSVRSKVKTFVTKARVAIATDTPVDVTEEAVREAVRELDIAVRKGVLHANNAARRKSRLMKRFHLTVGADA
jgi:small subunit ribosomal protein S20